VAVVRLLGRELRNLACFNSHRANQDAGSIFWASDLCGPDVRPRLVPVLWFDTSGGREGPVIRGLGSQSSPICCSLDHSPSIALARQLRAIAPGRSNFWT